MLLNLFDVLKILSSENKAKIIAHFWNCTCESHNCVGDIEELLNLSQSNLSKHLTALQRAGVLIYTQNHKERFYKINPDFRNQWSKLIDDFLKNQNETFSPFYCEHCANKK